MRSYRNRSPKARDLARRSRKVRSVAESIFWKELRDRKLRFKFRREHPVLGYRLDFFCPEAQLAVELDSEQHDPARDQVRDANLAELGIRVFRIPNRDYFSLDGPCFVDYLDEIVTLCEARCARTPHP